MPRVRCWQSAAAVVPLFMWLRCVEDAGVAREVGVVSAAISACDETVPANRQIDGIPAYAQCTASENSAIYSNNGVDTSLTQQGSDWVRTQWSGGYQCTELAHRYLHFKWQVKWIPNGNAGNWCDTQPPASSGVVQTMTPVHGDIMVLAPGSCGAGAETGHVNLIDTVDAASGRLMAVEQNRAGRNMYMQSCAKCFLHVVANTGAATAVGAAGTAAPPPAAAGGAGRAGATATPAGPSTDGSAARGGRAGSSAPSGGPVAGRSSAVGPNAGNTAPVPPVAPPTAAGGAPAGVATQSSPVLASDRAGAAAPVPTAARPGGTVEPSGCSVALRGESANLSAAWLVIAGASLLRIRRRSGRVRA